MTDKQLKELADRFTTAADALRALVSPKSSYPKQRKKYKFTKAHRQNLANAIRARHEQRSKD